MDDYLVNTYRQFHRIPELSRKEVRTNSLIRKHLDQWKIPYWAPSDNITIARIGSGKEVVALRADTDALPVREETGLEFASENPGVMHACGHDAHIACALTVGRNLKQIEEKLDHEVRLIFQPAEEGEKGAFDVMDTGLVNDVSAFYAMHVWSPYESGTLHVSTGGVAASCDMFTLKITGKDGHGAMPHECRDAVVCASNLVVSLQSIASRFTSPLDPVVVTVGSFHAGTRCNIIAGEAVLEGTIRTFNEETHAKVCEQLRRVIRCVCESYECTHELEIYNACDVTWNDKELTRKALEAARNVAGEDRIQDEEPSMLADDFSYYRKIAPVCYVKVGIRNEETGACYPHHSAKFRVDENALEPAVAWLTEILR